MEAIYPFASKIVSPTQGSQGSFFKGPSGVTIHYTADRNVDRAIQALKDRNFSYHLIIDRDGSVIQTCYFDKMTFHAGNAKWNDRSPNHEHLSVALVSWGYLTQEEKRFLAWNATEIPENEVAVRKGNLMTQGKAQPWDKATDVQEEKLLTVLSWFCANGILVEDICGHDECALPAGRKSDPGGVLSMTMNQLRDKLRHNFVS